MLSVCIPIYNEVVSGLVNSLHEQCQKAGINFEIVLIDDASEEKFQFQNRNLSLLEGVKYYELPKNIGRSAIRNLFLKYTIFEYLLFLDCDSEIPDKSFINRYLIDIQNKTEVSCGGRIYSIGLLPKHLQFRWKYGIKRECVAANVRKLKPYDSFLSNNFLISRQVFEKIKFDERLKNYGHEDSLFGFQLRKNLLKISHIENPVLHRFTETTDEFLFKTKQSLENLVFICETIEPGQEFRQSIRLLRWHEKLKKMHLCSFVAFVFKSTSGFVKQCIKTGFLSLMLHDFYKIGYLCVLTKKMPDNKIRIKQGHSV